VIAEADERGRDFVPYLSRMPALAAVRSRHRAFGPATFAELIAGVIAANATGSRLGLLVVGLALAQTSERGCLQGRAKRFAPDRATTTRRPRITGSQLTATPLEQIVPS
jgi:hypothetical protein